MAKIKIPDQKKKEILDHVYNTSDSLIKCYELRQLSLLEWKDATYIKNDPRFLPVRIDSTVYRMRSGKRWYTKTYVIKRIRLDEIKHIFNQRTWRKLVVEYY